MRIIFVRHGEPNYELDCLTETGRVMERRLRQLRNVSLSISSMNPLTSTLSRLVQFSKRLEPIDLTVLGMSI